MDVTERSGRDSPSQRRPLTWPGTALPRNLPRARPGAGHPAAPAAAAPADHITRTGSTGKLVAPGRARPAGRRRIRGTNTPHERGPHSG